MTSLLTMIGIGSTIGIISIYFVNKFPGEPTEYEAFAAEEASTMDVVRAFEKINSDEKQIKSNDKNDEKKEKKKEEDKGDDSLMGDFETFKKSKQYAKMKRMLGLTDTKIELAYELAKQGKMLPQPRAVRVVSFLDNLFLLFLLVVLVYAILTTYDVRATVRNIFPTEFDLVHRGYQRVSNLFADSLRHLDL